MCRPFDAHIFCCTPTLHLALAVCLRAGEPVLRLGLSSSLRRKLQLLHPYGSFLAVSSPARETAIRNLVHHIHRTEEHLEKTLRFKLLTTLEPRLLIHSLPNNCSLIHHILTVPIKTLR